MNGSRPKSEIRLEVVAADAATEILVLDGAFARVATGVGRLEAMLPPGLYKVKFLAADAAAEQLVEIPPVLPAGQEALRVEHPPLAFSSSAPLAGTAQFSKYHRRSDPQVLSHRRIRAAGKGSRIFVFVRDTQLAHAPHRPWSGVSLCTAAGRRIAGSVLAESELSDIEALHLEVDPGHYLLEVDTQAWGRLRMSIFTITGWQTQVFLDARNYQRSAGIHPSPEPPVPHRAASLDSASIFMARLGKGFDPDSPALRLSELARKALEQGRRLLRPGSGMRGELQAQLRGDFTNPMLGLYCLHLLLLEPERDLRLIEKILSKLLALGLERHPDLRACHFAALGAKPGVAFSIPPMLQASWRLLVKASADDTGLIPGGSLAAEIAPRLAGSGSWLVWESAGPDPKHLPIEVPGKKLTRHPAIARQGVREISIPLGGAGAVRGQSIVKQASSAKSVGDLHMSLDSAGMVRFQPLAKKEALRIEAGVRNLEEASLSRGGAPWRNRLEGRALAVSRLRRDLATELVAQVQGKKSRQPAGAGQEARAISYLEESVLRAVEAQGKDRPDLAELSRSLGLPASTVEGALVSLKQKLKRKSATWPASGVEK